MRVFGNFGSVLLKIYLNFCVLFLWFAVFFFSAGFKLCFLWGRFDCNDSPVCLYANSAHRRDFAYPNVGDIICVSHYQTRIYLALWAIKPCKCRYLDCAI